METSMKVLDVARPGVDHHTARDLVAERLRSMGEDGVEAKAAHLAALVSHYGAHPFTPLEQMRQRLGLDRDEFAAVLEVFDRVPELALAVEHGPAGKYWSNTIKPLNEAGALDAAVERRFAFPVSVGLYPGPTCMFRCHFCVRVTGARYAADSLTPGNEVLASVIDEVPNDGRTTMYMSGGLEPLTNPGLGELITRAANRGLDLTMYTNSFALTDATLSRQPGVWDLGALRTSLYGLNDEEYEETTTKKGAFSRVKANLQRFMHQRQERGSDLRLGFNHIILPGRTGRLIDLVDFIAELNESSPDRPLDFVTVREDYSGRDDGRLDEQERDELLHGLDAFVEYAERHTPGMTIDLGYALESLRRGVDAELLRIRPDTMRPTAHPQVAVQVDLLGDVYLYREAGFPDLDGAHRYIAGRVTSDHSLHDVLREFVESGREVEPAPGDEYFLDGFDQSVTARLNQLDQDVADGWGRFRGLVRAS
jgi:dTDP-4-amino-4,6-dideoxy-D-glucose ammonia-lyase